MRTTMNRRLWFATGVACVSALWGSAANAQPVEAGVNVPPVALILFDTSSSMEWLDDGPDHTFPTCTGSGVLLGATGGEQTRMHAAVQVLTGEVPNRYCVEDNRNTEPQRLDQVDPSRPQGIRHSRLCSRLTLTTNEATDCIPADPAEPTGAFPQSENGLIDEFDNIAFGFMAFDSFEEPDACSDGMFSYGVGRRMNGAGGIPSPPANPNAVPECGTLEPNCWNLGARRPFSTDPGAPACAGVAQGFTVPPLDPRGTMTQAQINDMVQEQILRVVPYWSTPLGAMLEDAYHLLEDPPDFYSYQAETGGHDATYGANDIYGECRRRFVVLITDGVPSYTECVRTGTDGPDTAPWDPDCEGYPYADAAYYASQLYEAGVQVYVIGFNISAASGAILNEIADAGGTDEARFASGSRSLVYEMGDILSQISLGTPSRTTPANTTRIRPGIRNGQYTFESNFEIHEGSPYWTGDISRVSRVCSAGTLGDEDEVSFAEWYDDLSASELSSRPILTTSPVWHSCFLKNSGTLSTSPFLTGENELGAAYGVTDAEIAAACQYGGEPGSQAGADSQCEDLTDGRVGFQDRYLVGSREAECLTELNVFGTLLQPHLFGADGIFAGLPPLPLLSTAQAEMYVRWLRGWTLTDLRTTHRDALERELPGAEYRWDSDTNRYTHDRVSRLPAIVHSSPTVVGRPDPRLQISEAYTEFVAATENRRSVVYVATADGLLRALDADTREEVFAFLPSSVTHRIGETMSSPVQVIDGSPIVEDIRTHRAGSDVERWMTVLLLPYRGGARGVVALDVTQPDRPRFLWEIDAELDPQLGLTYSRPAMGSVFMADCVVGSGPCERGVAVFGGGAPPSGLGDYSTTNIGRTMYVVDIETGIVIRRFTHARNLSGVDEPIASPVVGEVAGFDTFTGSLMTRAFVGTLGGQMLRLDMSSSDPTDWAVDVFFDPVRDIPTITDVPGGIFFRPTIALTRSTGRAVVIFGTGNLDDLDAGVVENNLMMSVTEQPEFNASGDLVRIGGELNWALTLDPSERLTARPRVFNRVAYFATFVPDTDPCDIGGARLYGLDFVGDESALGVVGDATDPAFVSYLTLKPFDLPSDENPYVPFQDASNFAGLDPEVIPEDSIIYAVEVTERLTCFEESDAGGQRGNGQNVALEVSDQGEFVLQIGASSMVGGTSSGTTQAQSQIAEMTVPDPPTSIIPTSWSVIFE